MHTYTFWQLANQYTIEIPIVQRDYAQGREDAKSKEIREKLLADLKESLRLNKPLELDFVYGKVNNKTFVPIDGQQRLTTLFLLHWYIGTRIGNEEIKKLSFSYKTRVSARDFCAGLIMKGTLISDDSSSISKQIEDAPWFFLAWKKDPTVQSMLTMLDSIHQQFNDKHQLEEIWPLLTERNYVLPKDNPKLNELVNLIRCDENINQQIKGKLEEVRKEPVISFKFLNLEEFELSDELYLKMNARGKALTDFENFKAWLIGYIQDKNFKITENNWTPKLDKEWTDLFWKFRDTNNSIDNRFMRFFVEIALCDYVSKTDSNYDDKDLIQAVQNLAFTEKKNVSYYSTKYFEQLQCFNEESLNFIFKILDKLHTSNGRIKIYGTVKNYIDVEKTFLELLENKQVTYSKRVTLYGYFKFICEEEIIEPFDSNFFHWMRVVRNIVENTTIDSPATFVGAIKGINKLLEFKSDTLVNLENGKISEKLDFFGTQIKEEILKAKLITKNIEWQEKIETIENHPFFKGSIGFLFSDNENSDLEKFVQWSISVRKVFDDDGVSSEYKSDAILLRAFVSQFNRWDQLWKFKYDSNKDNWKEILKNNIWHKPIQKVIDIESIDDIINLPIKESDFKDNQKKIHEDLYRSELLTVIQDSCYLQLYYETYILYPYNAKADWKKYVIGNKRNNLLSKLIQQKVIISDNQLKNNEGSIPFFWGWNVNFVFQEKKFVWKHDNQIGIEGEMFKLLPVGISQEVEFIEFIKTLIKDN